MISFENLRHGRTDEDMLRERLTAHPQPQDMIITKLGDPRPRLLPDNRVIMNGDLVATLTDQEAMEWLDGIEQLPENNDAID